MIPKLLSIKLSVTIMVLCLDYLSLTMEKPAAYDDYTILSHQLCAAVVSNDITKVKEILEEQPVENIRLQKFYNQKPLNEACRRGHLDIIKLLVSKGFPIRFPDRNQWTPLLYACNNNHLNAAKFLVANGADINFADFFKGTPLMVASHPEVIKLLLANGACVNAVKDEGYTPLILACLFNHPDKAELLLSWGAQTDLANKNGDTPLITASYYGYLGLVKVLLSNGADINHTNKRGKTARNFAEQRNHTEIVEAIDDEVAKREYKATLRQHLINYHGTQPSIEFLLAHKRT